MLKTKILVVEDERDVARVISINLELEDMEVVQVYDGKDALPCIRSENPDCIVLDIMLPHVSGWEILKSLKADPELEEIPVVVVTARVNERDQLRGLGGGAVKYITKPFNPEELTEAVKNIVGHQAERALARERREAIERLQLSNLHKISQILISAPGYKELLEGISEKLVSMGDLSGCAVLLFEGDKQEPVLYGPKFAPENKEESPPEGTTTIPDDQAKKIMTCFGGSPRPMAASSVQGLSLDSIFPHPRSVSNGYLIPLFSRGILLGVIIMGSNSEQSYSLDEEDLLVTIANQVVVALERATLHENVKEDRLLQRHLLHQTITAQERERKRIASEIHDSLIQSMVGISYQLQAMKSKASDDGVTEDISLIEKALDGNIQEVRRLVHGLRPTMLDDLGLATALTEYLREFGEKNLVQTYLDIPAEMPNFTTEAETTIYRIVQEALNNVEKHAHASEVSVEIEITPEHLFLSIKDDGKGMPVSAGTLKAGAGDRETEEARSATAGGIKGTGITQRLGEISIEAENEHMGLAIMKERAEYLGGKLKVDSRQGIGTTVLLEVPLTPIIELEV